MAFRCRFIVIFSFFSQLIFSQNYKRYIDSVRQAFHIPEVSYAIINEKDIKNIGSFGVHSVNLKDSASLNDRFHIGSNTKAMTAFMIAKYVEKGKLKWKTKFFDLFPEWKKTSRKEYYNITLEELLSHRTFVQPFQGENDPRIPKFEGNQAEQRKQFGKFVLTLSPAAPENGQHFVYSNAGYTLAALMIEKVTKKNWEQLMNQVFNTDLNLSIKFSWPENQKAKDTWGHSFENGQLTPIPSTTDYHLDYTEPSGDLNIKLPDYIKFIQMNLKGLKGESNYLQSSTYQYLHNHFPQYSMGWYNISEKNIQWSNHSGTAGTYYTLVHIDRTDGVAYIIFTNSFNEETTNGVRLIMRYLKKIK